MRIINIIGASGSGKTTIAKQLDGNIIQSYTTRPERYENEWGHIFVDSVDEENIVAYAELHGYEYYATEDQFIEGDNIYIVNPDGAEQVHEYFQDSDVEVITIYIVVDESVREERMITRYITLSYERIKYIVNNRLDADREEFKSVQCNRVIDGNRSITDVVADVRECLK